MVHPLEGNGIGIGYHNFTIRYLGVSSGYGNETSGLYSRQSLSCIDAWQRRVEYFLYGKKNPAKCGVFVMIEM